MKESSLEGAGSSSVTEIHNLEEIGLEDTIELADDESIRLKINNTEYLLVVNELTQSRMTLTLDNSQSSLNVGEETNIGFGNDNLFNLRIKLKSINTLFRKANILLNNLI